MNPLSSSLLCQGLIMGKLAHGMSHFNIQQSAYYQSLQYEINRTLQTFYNRIMQNGINEHTDFWQNYDRRALSAWMDKLKRNQSGEYWTHVPQAIILKQARLLSYEISHIKSKISRMNSILVSGRPENEFTMILTLFRFFSSRKYFSCLLFFKFSRAF